MCPYGQVDRSHVRLFSYPGSVAVTCFVRLAQKHGENVMKALAFPNQMGVFLGLCFSTSGIYLDDKVGWSNVRLKSNVGLAFSLPIFL